MNAESEHENREEFPGLLERRLLTLRLRRGWNMDHVAAAAGISRTTLFHLERGAIRRPRASTLHKLAQVFGVPVESLREGDFGFRISDFGSSEGDAALSGNSVDENQIRNPKSEIRNASASSFDRITNPIVTQVAAEEPALFAGWSADEWDELYSQFATGGALREEGVRVTAARINHDRETLYRLRVVLQTHLADVASGMVDTLYKLASVEPASEPRGDTPPAGSQAGIPSEWPAL